MLRVVWVRVSEVRKRMQQLPKNHNNMQQGCEKGRNM